MPFSNVAASSTDSVIVTAVPGKSIVVLGAIIAAGAVTGSTVVFNSKGSGAGTAISPTFSPVAGDVATLPISLPPAGYWFKTLPGESLTATTGAGSTTGINVTVQIV